MRIVAALGSSGRAPVLVEVPGGAVVLGPVPPEELAQVAHPGVLSCVGSVETNNGRRGLYPYTPGLDLGQLADRHLAGLPGEVLIPIAGDLLGAIESLGEVGLRPDVREDAIRIGVDGRALFVAVRKGRQAEATRELIDLMERLCVESEGPALGAAMVSGDVSELTPRRRLTLPDLPATGPTTLTLEGRGPAVPPRLVVARISVLVLALGLSMGWMLAPRSLESPVVHVVGAESVSLQCAGGVCEVEATFSDGDASGRLEASAPHYRCTRTSRTLACTASSP